MNFLIALPHRLLLPRGIRARWRGLLLLNHYFFTRREGLSLNAIFGAWWALMRQVPERASRIASVAARGSGARMISPITAIPCAPAARHCAAFPAATPPSATTAPEAC